MTNSCASLLSILMLFASITLFGQNTEKYDCQIIKVFLEDSMVNKYFHPVAHSQDSLIFNDSANFLDSCTSWVFRGRPIFFKSFSLNRFNRWNTTINITKMSRNKDVFHISVYYIPTGSTVYLMLKKEGNTYKVCDRRMGAH